MININKTDVPNTENQGISVDNNGIPVRWDLQHTTYLYLFPETIEIAGETIEGENEISATTRTIALEVEISKEDDINKSLQRVILQVCGESYSLEMSRKSALDSEDQDVLEYKKFVEESYQDLRRIYGIVDTIEDICEAKLREISEYDTSSEVNCFYYQGVPLWLDKATRVGLMNSTTIQKNLGQETSTLWLGSMSVTLPVDSIIQMLGALEVYALECYNVTAQHKNNVVSLESIQEIQEYNYKTGYPDKLEF